MKAAEARKISNENKVIEKDVFLENAFTEISEAAQKGKYEIELHIGEGTLTDKCFSKYLHEQEDKLEKLGYTVKSTYYKIPWSLGFRFDYYLIVMW